VGLDTVAEVSTAVSAALHDSDALGGAAYAREVTSPGRDRRLPDARLWRRDRSRRGTAGRAVGSTVAGRVTEADVEAVTLDVDGTPTRLALSDVTSGRVQVEFRRGTEEG
jgi:ribosome maturation factor RimP